MNNISFFKKMNKNLVLAHFYFLCMELLHFLDIHGDGDIHLENTIKDIRHKFHSYLKRRDAEVPVALSIFKELYDLLRDHRCLVVFEKMAAEQMKKLAEQM